MQLNGIIVELIEKGKKAAGLKINIKKTKILGKEIPGNIKIEEEIIEEVDSLV